MADADPPDDDGNPAIRVDQAGFYQLKLNTRTLRYTDDDNAVVVVPEENMTPFNLQAFVAFDEEDNEIVVRPRATYGAKIDPACVLSATYMHSDLIRFLLEDSQNPNDRLAGKDFIEKVTTSIWEIANEMHVVGLWRCIHQRVRNRADRNRLLQRIAPVFPDPVFPEAQGEIAIPWYTGPGVYRVTRPGAFAPKGALDNKSIETNEYNRYAFVYPYTYAGIQKVFLISRFSSDLNSQTLSKPSGYVTEFAERAEKVPGLDLNWFLLTEIPEDEKTASWISIEAWHRGIRNMPEGDAAKTAIMEFCTNYSKDNRYTRYLQRRIRIQYAPDTYSLKHAMMKNLVRMRDAGEFDSDDEEQLPPSLRRQVREYTSVRFHV